VIDWGLVEATVARLHRVGLHDEARRFSRRCMAQSTEEGVRALVRGYFPEDDSASDLQGL
jgi:hypothetical protein